MVGRFAFDHLSKYPHMQPLDVAVWERFISTHPDYFERVDYDVLVGTGVEPTGKHDANVEAGYQTLTQKKIDVVGYKDGKTTIVEVKPIANMRGLGQIIVYSHLYADDHQEAGPLTRLIVAGEMERELEPVFASQGVEVAIV